MIEDRRGYADIDAIAAVDGIAGLHVGPVDLSLGLGLEKNDPRFVEALKSILEVGHRNRLPVTQHAVAGHEAAHWIGMGFDDLVLTADIELIRAAFAWHLSQARRL
jgi:4-hydroxy-2-oxoheptanedioate aldolase